MTTGCGSSFDDFRSQCIGTYRPNLKDLYKHVTKYYAAQWKNIGISLDIELAHLNIIKANCPGDVVRCCNDLWDKWLELDPDATWDKLFTAIDEGIHSTTTSEPATTVKSSILDVSRLKARYIKLLPTGKTDWPKHKVTQYVKLAIVKKEDVTIRDKHLNELTRLTLQGDIDNILKKKEPLGDLKDIFHYNNEDCPRLILIIGGPGIGKTTLCHELCLRWARDGYLAEDFDVVALIPLRSVQQRSLEEVVMRNIGEDNYQQLKKTAGSRCLIILEGFDEITINRRQNDSFLLYLIKDCTLLEKATILITSRPHACEEIDAGRRIEVVGFGNDQIKEFAEKSFPNDVERFIQQLHEYPQLHSLCYIPMNLVMLVDIFHCSKKKLPSTLTELYRLFIVMTLNRQIRKDNVTKKPAACSSVAVRAADSAEETLCAMLSGIPKESVGIVKCLSKLAYRGFFDWYCQDEDDQEGRKEPRIIFTELDLVQCNIEVTSDFDGFGLLKATPTHEVPIDINTYSFNHLTIQEFLCAVYFSLQSQQEQLLILREHFHEYPYVSTFVFGLTGLASNEMFQFIYSKLTLPGESYAGDPDVITAMRCINESKQSGGPHHSVSPFTLNVAFNDLSPYECVCVSHVLSCYPVLALKMNLCLIGNEGAELLVKHYSNFAGLPLEELIVSSNDLTSKGMEHVIKIIETSSATLRELNVGDNDINDDGMAVISEALQHSKSLTTLSVVECGLSVKGAVYISQLLNVTHKLQQLDIGRNDINDEGMAVILKALQHIKSLTRLSVERCGLSVEGAISISKMMMVNHSLQELYIGGNSIGDDGISAIARALSNCKINKLNVDRCNITLIGATSLSAVLSSNHTIRNLWLEGNPITVEGALLIVKSAVDNTVCQYVHVDYEYYENYEVTKMMNILRDRGRQEDSSSSDSFGEDNMYMYSDSDSISEDNSCEDIPPEELLLQSQLIESITETNHLKNKSESEGTRESITETNHLKNQSDNEDTRESITETNHLKNQSENEDTRESITETNHLKNQSENEDTRESITEANHLKNQSENEDTRESITEINHLKNQSENEDTSGCRCCVLL